MCSARPLLRIAGASSAALVLILLCRMPAPSAFAGVGRTADSVTATFRPATTWAFDPAEPGPDRPPLGRSLFDHLFVTERDGAKVYDVPFPFTALRRRILERLGAGAPGSEALAQVLIPLGRALQRDAAAPDFFAHPRLVLAIVADSPSPAGTDGMHLKDRLYIGYQEKAENLEVISYNETAGRFEFQIVKDYAPGKTPRVVYANRSLCVSCHQNGAPIFSDAPWSETDANTDLAERLRREGARFHGVEPGRGNRATDNAFAISSAVERANFFPAYQEIWRRGCGTGPASNRCRAAILTLALQHKLSSGRHFDLRSDSLGAELTATLTRNWARRWPGGLAVANPRLPDRDPLATGADVPADLDPLVFRAPLFVWSPDEERDFASVITGVAEFIANGDAARIDRHLRASARTSAVPRAVHEVSCAVSRHRLEVWADRFFFRCEDRSDDAVSLNGFFYVGDDGRVDGAISRLTFAGMASFEDLAFAAERIVAEEQSSVLAIQPFETRTGLSPRLPDGSAIESVHLAWDALIEEDIDPSAELPVYQHNARLVLTVVRDFGPVRKAVADLLHAAGQGRSDVFSDGPFRRAVAIPALYEALGIEPAAFCCVQDLGFPPLAVERPGRAPAGEAGEPDPPSAVRHAFAVYCAVCHATPAPFPPNFLYGETGPSGDAIAQCGERIAFRLAMWDWPEAGRTKSPMPPDSWLRSAGLTPRQWRDGAALAALRGHMAGLLALTGSSAGQVEMRGRQAYEGLKPCLAQPTP
jgi:mono/diheme cytochrome c family protein